MKSLLLYSVILFGLLITVSCTSTENQSLEKKVVVNYSNIVLANYHDTYQKAQQMQKVIEIFLAEPSEKSLINARRAWLNAREYYGQTEAFRFYGGPIDDKHGPEGQLNAWPLDEAYIDYVEDLDPSNSIIYDTATYPMISADLIASLNEKGSETNVSSGYHAIEFLLWGQDLSAGAAPGNRPYTDYINSDKGTAAFQKRRSTYLSEVTKLLISDLERLNQAWDSSGNNYREDFIAQPEASIEKILAGLGKLSKGELAGERMYVAYDLRSKEDEHSCFSDNTHRDIVANALGIQNVYMGAYKGADGELISGKGIYDLLKQQNESLADELKTAIEESIRACMAIEPPFDQEINSDEGRIRVAKAISLLRKQGDKFAEAAKVLGYEINPNAI